MKKFQEEKGEIHEYFFKDWEKGYIPTKWFTSPGDFKITNEYKKIHFDRISLEEFAKIQEASKKRFYERIEEELTREKQYLSRKLEQSLDKERFIEHQIHKFEWNCGLTDTKPTFQSQLYYQSTYKTMYHKHKILGSPDEYFHTNSANFKINTNSDLSYIMFEVDYQIWKILKSNCIEMIIPILKNVVEKESIIQPFSKIENKPRELSLKQIALIYAYKGNIINRENGNEIAKKYGFTAKNSGEALYQKYLKYCKMSDRKARPTSETKKALKNKITLFESILNHLNDNEKQLAIDEITILKHYYEVEY